MALTEQELALLKELRAAKDAPRPANQDGNDGTDWRGGARALGQGIWAGFLDEATGLAVATAEKLLGPPEGTQDRSFMEVYRDVRDAERAEQARFAAENPWTNIGLQIAGTAITGGLGAATAPGRVLAARTAGMGALPRSMAVGGATGGAESLGRTEADLTQGDIGGVAKDVAIGTGAGMVAGPLAEGFARVAAKPAGWAYRKLFENAETDAQRAIRGVLDIEGSSPEDVARHMADLGPGATPGMTPELTMVMRETASKHQLRVALDERLASQADDVIRVADDVAAQRGLSRESFNQGKRRLARAQQAAAHQQYAAAYRDDIPSESSNLLRQLLDDPEVPAIKKAYEAARKSSANRRGQADYRPLRKLLDKQGSDNPDDWLWTDAPGWREWDLIQRYLRSEGDRLRKAAGLGTVPGHEYRDMRMLRSLVVDELDRINPDFRTARQTYAGLSAVQDAMSYGRDVFGKKVDVEDLSEMIADMAQSERLALAAGARKAIASKAKNTRTAANLYKAMLNDPAAQEKLVLVFGADGADLILERLRQTGQQIGSLRTAAEGSATALQQQVRDVMNEAADTNVMGNLATGNIPGAAQGAVRSLLPQGLSPAARIEIGRAMVDPDRFRELMARRPGFGMLPPPGGTPEPRLPVSNIWGAAGAPVIAEELLK